jgi:hypothetical protein
VKGIFQSSDSLSRPSPDLATASVDLSPHAGRGKKAKRHRPVLWSGDGSACRRVPQTRGSGAPTGASTIPRLRGAARVLRDTLASRRSTAAILAAGTAPKTHPDRPFGLLIPRASAGVRPGAIYQLWRALIVGPGSTPRLPEMACETIRRRRTRSANQDASRWRPRMSRQQQDTERREEKSLHAGDMRG